MTTGISTLSRLKRDADRLEILKTTPLNQLVWHQPHLASFTWYTPWHPIKFQSKALNALTEPFFRQYGKFPLYEMETYFKQADLVVFESTSGLMLFDRVRKLNPNAQLVYRVSDDLRLTNAHPCLLQIEQRIAPQFDLISLPSKHLREIFPPLDSVVVHPQGIKPQLFDRPSDNPYVADGRINAVSVGTMLFDPEFVIYASQAFPEIHFHIIGGMDPFIQTSNVTFYGEMSFEETIPYVQWADLGLAIYRANRRAAAYLSQSSNKMIQYTYCQLPIVAPSVVCEDRLHAFAYYPDRPETISQAIQAALKYDRALISIQDIPSWSQLGSAISENHRVRTTSRSTQVQTSA
jgi:2-beta-glucuronyltransferase